MEDRIAVIGAGIMGGAIITSLRKGGCKNKIIATDIRPEKLMELEKLDISTTVDNLEAAKNSDIIFISVKPSDIENVMKTIKKEIDEKLVISVAATVPLEFLYKFIPEAKIIRIMPNVAALAQASYTAYCCGKNVSMKDKNRAIRLFNLFGRSEEVKEKYMDAITALSGSGPGYLSIIIEGLMYAGLKVGLPRNIALNSAAQTVLGTGKLVLDLQMHPAKIKDMVTTPGGTTIEAIYELEGSQIRQALMNAVNQAAKKSQQIREKLNV
ncbi:MAG: hypothetical protein AC479_05865 [miscellaneous Crenarchaeota group-6 archaeon AD8-1]|nr:MAG: hypothetical protein AC479_05865 [miscellaneous Crenarchaeota group-6 archaeon AD8-1]